MAGLWLRGVTGWDSVAWKDHDCFAIRCVLVGLVSLSCGAVCGVRSRPFLCFPRTYPGNTNHAGDLGRSLRWGR